VAQRPGAAEDVEAPLLLRSKMLAIMQSLQGLVAGRF
jgi:hypothetical protein